MPGNCPPRDCTSCAYTSRDCTPRDCASRDCAVFLYQCQALQSAADVPPGVAFGADSSTGRVPDADAHGQATELRLEHVRRLGTFRHVELFGALGGRALLPVAQLQVTSRARLYLPSPNYRTGHDMHVFTFRCALTADVTFCSRDAHIFIPLLKLCML